MFDPLQFVLVTLVVFTGGVIQGSLGYGIGLVCVPFLTLINPQLVPVPMLVAVLIFNLSVALREKSTLDFFGLKWITIGGIPGTFLGAWVLAVVSLRIASIVIGAIVILAVLVSVIGVRVKPRKIFLLPIGVLAGGMAAIAMVGGPPVALVYQDEPGNRLRPTLAGFFILAITFSLISYALLGKFSIFDFWQGLLMLPGIMTGYLLSSRIIKHLKQSHIRTGILLMSSVSGVIVILRQLI